MGYGAAEFAKVLAGGFSASDSGIQLEPEDDGRWQVLLTGSGNTVTISTVPQPPRQLGAISLPVLEVCFDFGQCDQEERDTFIERFNRYFHKGGG